MASATTTRGRANVTLERVRIGTRFQRSTIIPTHAPCQRSDDRVEIDHLDPDQMHQLYSDHAAALRRFALRLTGSFMHAEDVVQETLLRAWQHPEVTGDVER